MRPEEQARADLDRAAKEKCSCGHGRLSHTNTVAIGHGVCLVAKCPCMKFTWVHHEGNL